MSNNHRLLVSLLFAVLIGSCSTYEPTNEKIEAIQVVQTESTASQLLANRVKWESNHLEDYEFELSAAGYLRAFDRRVRVTVRNGRCVSIKKEDGKDAYSRIYDEFNSVDKVFSFLSTIDAKRPDVLEVVYDSDLGFPALVELDEKKGISDDEITLKLSNLRSL